MRTQRLSAGLAIALTAAGTLLVTLRLASRQGDSSTRRNAFWRLRYELDLRQVAGRERLHVSLPQDTPACRVLAETFTHAGVSMDIIQNRQTGAREVVLLTHGSTLPCRMVAHFDIQIARDQSPAPPLPKETLPAGARAHLLRSERTVQAASRTVRNVLAELKGTKSTREETVQDVFAYCSDHIADGGASDAEGTLREGAGSHLGRARAMVALCRAAKVPARLVAGFVLDDGQDEQPHVWVETHLSGRWLPFDPQYGYAGDLPPTHLPLRRDDTSILRGPPGLYVAADFAVRRLPEPPGDVVPVHTGLAAVLDLTRLPIGMRNTLAVLLLLPVGALITAVCRNLIGVETFGTFTPALLALSFVYSDWRTGLLLLVLILGIGVAGRSLIERLKLLMVPRLGLILTFVVLATVLAVSVLDHLGLTPSARAVVFPMVILTMIIERLHIRMQEEGLRNSLRLLAATFVVAACCFAILLWERLGHTALAFPEGLLFVAAALVLIGRYSGYRLIELWRFRDFARPDWRDGTV